MLSKNDLYLLKWVINFAKDSMCNSVDSFDKYVESKLRNESAESLKWKLDELLDRMDDIKLDVNGNVDKNDEIQEDLSLINNKEDEDLKATIISILSELIEDGKLGLYKEYDYDNTYIGLSIDDGEEVVTPRFSFSGPISLGR